MGGYDPRLVEVGIACQETVEAIPMPYPSWRTLRKLQDFDLEMLVSDVVAQVTTRCPAGPVLLAGYSFGGIVAFSAATRLRDAGREVRFLGLLDVEALPRVDVSPGALRAPKTRWQELRGFMAALRRGDADSKLAYVVARRLKSPRWEPLLRLYAQVPRRVLVGRFFVFLDRDLLSEHMEPLLRQWVSRYDALRPLPVPAYLFRTDQHSANAPRDLRWGRCCPDLTVVSVSGTHLGMLKRSNLPALNALFREAVLQVLGRPAPQ